MNINIKKITFNDSFDYIKDTLHVLQRNYLFTFLFLIANIFIFFIDTIISFNIFSLLSFASFLVCATLYAGNISFFSANKQALKLGFYYTLFIFFFSSVIELFSYLATFYVENKETAEQSSFFSTPYFWNNFLYSILYSLILTASYYMLFLVYLIYFLNSNLLSQFASFFFLNFYVFFVSYFLLYFLFLSTLFLFKVENEILKYFLVGSFNGFLALFTFIAINDILGISKVKRKLKNNVVNKNIETI